MARTARSGRGLALACHPGPTVVVTGLAAALAVGLGSTLRTTVLVTAAVLTGQLSVGWSNDWIDAERDSAVHRVGKPLVRGLVDAATLRTAALAALGLCVPLSFALGWVPGAVHLVAVAVAWGYNAGLKSSVASGVPYVVSFALLLLFVVLAQPGRPLPRWWAVVGAGLLGLGAHLANVLPDLEDDHATGVRGLPHRLGRTRTAVLALAALVAATTVLVLGPARPPDALTWWAAGTACALAAAGAVVALVDRTSALPFVLSMTVAGACVVLLVHAGTAVVHGTGTLAPIAERIELR